MPVAAKLVEEGLGHRVCRAPVRRRALGWTVVAWEAQRNLRVADPLRPGEWDVRWDCDGSESSLRLAADNKARWRVVR